MTENTYLEFKLLKNPFPKLFATITKAIKVLLKISSEKIT